MNIVRGLPPNFAAIKDTFKTDSKTCFCYGDTIYTTSDESVPEDVIYHESIHSKQQSVFTDPSIWWIKYMHDKTFRLEQEIEAFAAQYAFVKKHTNNKIAKEALFDFASTLAGNLYDLHIPYPKAESMIRHRSKLLV